MSISFVHRDFLPSFCPMSDYSRSSCTGLRLSPLGLPSKRVLGYVWEVVQVLELEWPFPLCRSFLSNFLRRAPTAFLSSFLIAYVASVSPRCSKEISPPPSLLHPKVASGCSSLTFRCSLFFFFFFEVPPLIQAMFSITAPSFLFPVFREAQYKWNLVEKWSPFLAGNLTRLTFFHFPSILFSCLP